MDPDTAEHLRRWRLLRLGVSLAEQETASAVELDWLLAVDGEWHRAEQRAAEDARR